ncbi:hypothetical protein [Picosynechococcus sp. NKBG15041c]|uniref:hypothetical protein n=1 Tax=Picosynechococcus sp. NKBG15041c TaxID=1407650 RepID=UPI00041132F0|nr:hypothetical protein [Picosynechococcus sp. NKBG15041c]
MKNIRYLSRSFFSGITQLLGLLIVVVGLILIFQSSNTAETSAREYLYTPSETNLRGIQERIVYEFPDTGLKLTMPRFLKNPKAFETPGKDVLVMLRTAADTCGLYQIAEAILPPNAGPPPHFHFATDEWFFSTESSLVRLYASQEPQDPLQVGQIPGINVDPVKVGSVIQNQGEILFSPKGMIHYFRNETPGQENVRGFYNIWAPGYGVSERFEDINNLDGSHADLSLAPAQQVFLQTALWGMPHDITGGFVGTEDYYDERGPVFTHPDHLEQLQELFDAGEACYPHDE